MDEVVVEDATPQVDAEVIVDNNPAEVIVDRVGTVVIDNAVVPDPNQVNPGVFSV